MKQTFDTLLEMAGELAPHIEQMRQAYEALERERDELAAHVERLRDAMIMLATQATHAHDPLENIAWFKKIARTALTEAPTQSLRHIEHRVEEETMAEDMAYMHLNGNIPGCVARILKNRPRKYPKEGE